jgi:hypothetical protein
MSDSKKGQIDSDKVVIVELFSRFWFSIPAYQRSYVWGKDQIAELIDDVNYASEHNPEAQYFLGSMVLCRAKRNVDGVSFEEVELIDGQQRVTTLYLLLASIRDRVTDDELKKTCRDMLYQHENKWINIPGRNRIVYHIRDNVGEFIEHYVKPNDGTTSADLTAVESSKNLSLANMAQGLRTIRDCFDDKERFADATALGRFTKYLLNNVLFIYVATEDLDDAFRLFTILNDRGIRLSNSDVLKARNLGALSSETDEIKWARFWEEIEGEFDGDEFDRFLSLVRTIYVKDKAREGLLKEFDERIYRAKPPLLTLGTSTFEAVKAYKTAYDEAILFNPLPPALGHEYRNRTTAMRRGLPSTDWMPPVLAWYRKFNTKKLLDLLIRIDNKFSADWIAQFTPTQRIRNMNDVLKTIDQAKDVDVVLTAPVFAYDHNQILNLLDGPIYGRRFAKYVLLRLEHLYFNHSSVLNLPDELSMEHILPQTPAATSTWSQDFTPAQHEKWVDRLGNLMLLSRRKNTSLGNLDFADKKVRYFKDNVETLPNSARVLTLPSFDLPALGSRQDELLKRLRDSYRPTW